MRLTTKGRFAVTAMIDVALHHHAGPVALIEVSERQNISLSYLEQLFSKLRRRGIVESVRGSGGGYHLAREADALSVAEIIIAVDEPLDATNCGGKENCHEDGGPCLTHELWSNLNDQIFGYLSGIKLGDLVTQARLREQKRALQLPVNLIDNRPRFRRATHSNSVL